jgi:hypothetical protein
MHVPTSQLSSTSHLKDSTYVLLSYLCVYCTSTSHQWPVPGAARLADPAWDNAGTSYRGLGLPPRPPRARHVPVRLLWGLWLVARCR